MKIKNFKSADVTSTDDVRKKELFRMDRRTFVKVAGTTVGAIAFGTGLSRLIEPAMAAPPVRLKRFVDALVIPPALIPDTTTYDGVDYYEIPIVQGTTHKFHGNLPPTNTYSYFAPSPALEALEFHYLGPTIIAKRGTPVKIKFTNSLPTGNHLLHSAIDTTIMGSLDETGSRWTDENRVCVHLHGGKVKPEFDGGPRDWFSPADSDQANPYPEAVDTDLDGSYTYEYPNDQPATLLWYHDHAWGITRFNPFAGLAAAYVLRDDQDTGMEDNPLGLPAGNYEVPIVLQDKLLDPVTGAMLYPVANNPPDAAHPLWIPEYFGDTPVVNGKAYPYLQVEPRRYRFRFLNGSNARFYSIWFQNISLEIPVLIPMWVIGSEQGFLSAPAMVNKLVIAPGERFDTIFDFGGMPDGTVLTLMNNAKAPYPGGRGGEIPQIMQFRVNLSLTGADDTTDPNALTLPPIATITALPNTPPNPPWREIVLSEIMDPVTGGPKEALLDGLHFVDTIAPNPPLFVEQADSVNVWQFINITGDAHPMHPHLVPFKILNRQPFDVARFTADWNAWVDPPNNRAGPRPSIDNYLKGAAYGPAPEETGWKDTAKAYPGEVLRIVAEFKLPAGLPSGVDYRYVCHCHILEHEENDMMFYYAVRK